MQQNFQSNKEVLILLFQNLILLKRQSSSLSCLMIVLDICNSKLILKSQWLLKLSDAPFNLMKSFLLCETILWVWTLENGVINLISSRSLCMIKTYGSQLIFQTKPSLSAIWGNLTKRSFIQPIKEVFWLLEDFLHWFLEKGRPHILKRPLLEQNKRNLKMHKWDLTEAGLPILDWWRLEIKFTTLWFELLWINNFEWLSLNIVWTQLIFLKSVLGCKRMNKMMF